MKSNNEENKSSDNNEGNQNLENNLNRLDSPNNADNETISILQNKNININNEIELDNPLNINKEIHKTNFFHDKEITEDSIIYFSDKLKQNNNSYKLFLYISIILYILDLGIFFISNDNVMNNYFNFCSIILILISVIWQAYIFRNNFESISKELYDLTIKIIYIYNILVITFLVNIMNLVLFQIKNKDKVNVEYNIIDNPLFLFFYDGSNFLIPIVLSKKLFSIKKGIKNLSAAKGEIYESAKIEDVQIINSVINEI